MTTTNRECFCACHDNKPPANTDGLRHDDVCCEEMNGQLEWFRVKELLTIHDQQLHQALLSGLPKYNHKISRSYFQANYNPQKAHKNGYRLATREVTQLINKVFNKEKL